MLPKIIGYVTTFKDKDRGKDKNKNNKLMSSIKLKYWQNIELNPLPVYEIYKNQL